MRQELNLFFQNTQQVTIHFAQYAPVTIDFIIPLTAQDREAIRHYLEVYAAQYVMDIDDQEAQRVTQQLPQWGKSYLMRYLIMCRQNNYLPSLLIHDFRRF